MRTSVRDIILIVCIFIVCPVTRFNVKIASVSVSNFRCNTSVRIPHPTTPYTHHKCHSAVIGHAVQCVWRYVNPPAGLSKHQMLMVEIRLIPFGNESLLSGTRDGNAKRVNVQLRRLFLDDDDDNNDGR